MVATTVKGSIAWPHAAEQEQTVEHSDTRRDYLDVSDVANLIPGMSRSALYTQKHRGQAPGALAIRVGKRLVWRRADIERWFSEQVEAARDAGGER
jgi:predicted DNA-binding transcriptional regulator AlpA